jgi:hypothetical protein
LSTTAPNSSTVPAQNYYPSFKSSLCAWQGQDIQANTLQGAAGTGGLRLTAGGLMLIAIARPKLRNWSTRFRHSLPKPE